MSETSPAAQRLHRLQQRILNICQQIGRDPADVQLLAVSKTRPLQDILELYELGQCRFGENYPQELVRKVDALTSQAEPPVIEWHFIGALQTNKTRWIAERAAWVHSVDRERIAQRLSEQRPDSLPPLQVCIQVDLSQEPGKSGIPESEVTALAETILHLPRLQLRGLMTLPAPTPDPERQREAFARLRQHFTRLQQAGFPLDTLSMGMSDDLEAAITEGATLIRIGTALFGARPQKTQP